MTRLDNWQWRKVEIPSLAKFVNPEAANLLRLSQNHEQLEATPAGRRHCIELIYQALLAREIRYVRPEYHPESEIQAIRQPIEVLHYLGSGTCLDLALLFCGGLSWLSIASHPDCGRGTRTSSRFTETPLVRLGQLWSSPIALQHSRALIQFLRAKNLD